MNRMNLSGLGRLGKVAGIGGIAIGAVVLLLNALIGTTAGGRGSAEKTSGSTNKARGTMPLKLFIITLTSALLAVMAAGGPALAQKAGGILKLSHRDSPASMSILEESTGAALQPMMGVFNNLVMYDQHIAQSSLETIVPDLATSWSWSEDGTELTFPLR